MTSLLLTILAFLPLQDQEEKKTSRQVFIEAQRLETIEKNLDQAVQKYNTALNKAEEEGNSKRAAECLRNIARCYENMESENISGAMDAYQRIVDEYSEFDELSEMAQNKLSWKGIDTWLARYANSLKNWRMQKNRGSADALQEFRTETWDKIQGLGTGATSGLLHGLGHPDEVVRSFSAENLARVTDENGISDIITHLDSDNAVVRGGAALALENIFTIWRKARDLDRQADTILKNFNTENLGGNNDPILDKAISQAKNQAENLREKASSLRGNLPENLNGSRIQDALAQVISDEEADATARLEATHAALSIGEVSGELVTALTQGMSSKNRNVRVGCARAAAAVDTEKGSDKHRLADAIIKLVQYVPGRDWTPSQPEGPEAQNIKDLISKLASEDDQEAAYALNDLLEIGDSIESLVRQAAYRSSGDRQRGRFDRLLLELEQRRWANDTFVREAMARSLGDIGLIKAVPALLRALEDTSSVVRKAANDALILLTGLDFDYEPNPQVQDPGLEMDPPQITMDEASKRLKQVEIRNEGIQRWKDWWEQTRGVSVLLDRFWKFQSQWKAYDPADLFDKDLLRKNISRTSSDSNRDFNLERADRIYEKFHRQKDVFVMDAVDLGNEALDVWMDRLDGSNPDQEKIFDKIATQQKKRLVQKSRRACRYFVADVISTLAEKSGNGSSISSQLRSAVSSGGEKGAGAALAIGNLDRSDVGSSSRSSLNEALRGLSDELKEAAALALMRVGDSDCAGNLADVALLGATESNANSPKARASIAALRALAAIKAQNRDATTKVGTLIGDEPEDIRSSKKALLPLVRQFACEALESMANSSIAPMIIRARRDTIGEVRHAAASAISEINGRDSNLAREIAKILNNKDTNPSDRIGAALALGDTGQESRAYDLVYRIVDENSPRKVRDQDPAVRSAAAQALGGLGNKTQFTIKALLAGMEDSAEDVRQQAYNSLRTIVGEDIATQHTISIREEEGQNPKENEFKGWYSADDRKKFMKSWKKWFERNKSDFSKNPPRES